MQAGIVEAPYLSVSAGFQKAVERSGLKEDGDKNCGLIYKKKKRKKRKKEWHERGGFVYHHFLAWRWLSVYLGLYLCICFGLA